MILVAYPERLVAARPSGTENIYKIYGESFRDQSHLDAIVSEAQEIVKDALAARLREADVKSGLGIVSGD